MSGVDWERTKRALPMLFVVTIILDALLFRDVDPAPPLEVAFWAGVYVGTTFLLVVSLYLFWQWL